MNRLEKIKKNLEILPDLLQLRWIWLLKYRSWLNLAQPRTFAEKLQWIKLYGRDERMRICADKYRVREYVAQKVGPKILNELYGVYERVEDVDLARLPESFALKVNHHSGGNVFCKDKAKLDWPAAKKFLNKYRRRDHYKACGEWSYKDIPRRIVAEKYLEENGKAPTDYKFFCFNGKPLFLGVFVDRFGDCRRSYFDLDWNVLPFAGSTKYELSDEAIPRPDRLEEMAVIAGKLAAGFPFVRIDLYCVGGKVIFGEMTFFPAGGWLNFSPASYDEYWGGKIRLPDRCEAAGRQ